MTYLVTLYILVINFSYSFIKNSKAILYSTIVFMVLLFGGISNCADDYNYQMLYEAANSEGFTGYGVYEIGFSYLAVLGNKIGLTYELFRTLIAIIGLILMQKLVLEYTKKYNAVFLLYFIYPFMLNVIQIRNFLAASIIVYSIRFLVDNSKSGDIKYLIGILIAVSIHYSSVFFLPFIFFKRFSIRQLIIISILLIPILCVLTSYTIIPDLVNSIVGTDIMFNLEFYFQKANWGFLLSWIKQISIFILSYLCYAIIKNSDINDKWKLFDKIIIKLNIYLMIFCFPLVIYNANFLRLNQNILVLNYIIISQLLYLHLRKGLVYYAAAIILSLMFLADNILYGENVLQVLIPFFQSNSYL